jgi:crotonobetainyl-CoA:carnitine CoA-transferase CaiB-like acyl-CoA transferase
MGALSGLTVLDVGFYAPGRWAAMVLGDLGADVICLEMPRGTRPADFAVLDDDTHQRWLWYQRNKRSLEINLKTQGGQRAFQRLARRADVVIESYKPGTAKRLGADYESVRAVNEAIVYASVSSFGQTGPYRDLIAHEPNYQALSGALGQNGSAPNRPPAILPAIVGDLGGGASNVLVSVLAALLHRGTTGEGQYIDVAITAGVLPYVAGPLYASWSNDPYRQTSMSSNTRPEFRVYETKDGKYVAVSAIEPWLWERLCRAIGREELAPLHQPSGSTRERVIDEMINTFRMRTQAEWTEVNLTHNVSITPVLTTVEEIEADPQMIHREMILSLEYEPLGTVKQVGIPYQMTRTPAEVRWIPRYGEHTEEVLRELGYSVSEVHQLRLDGSCG